MKASLLPTRCLGALLLAFAGLCFSTGCGNSTIAPVEGKIFLDGKPLAFGSVTLQPAAGQPATGLIQPDGSFTMKTGPTTGATIGSNQVRVTCYESQGPSFVPPVDLPNSFGKLLIPERYTKLETSPLSVDVQSAGVRDLELHLTSKPTN